MFFRKAGGQGVLVPALVLSGGYRGRGAGDITRGHSRWLADTNYGFNLLLPPSLTPLHLAADISTCDILTISLKSLVLSRLNFSHLSVWVRRLSPSLRARTSCVQQLNGTFVFRFGSCHPFLSGLRALPRTLAVDPTSHSTTPPRLEGTFLAPVRAEKQLWAAGKWTEWT